MEFMNLFYSNLDARFTKFNVYNVLTMTDDFIVVSGMPNNIGIMALSSSTLECKYTMTTFQETTT